MANQSIKSAFERFWHHVVLKLNDYATTKSLDAHIDDVSNPHNVDLSQLGVTATADEINSIKGVTSNVQEQLSTLSGLVGDTSVSEQIANITAVSYTEPQTLTQEQQAQARENIGVTQADWLQDNPEDPSYIKNRICYDGHGNITVKNTDSSVVVPFTELIGLKIIDTVDNRHMLTSPSRKPNDNEGIVVNDNLVMADSNILHIEYGTFNGALDKQCLFISGNTWSFYDAEWGYTYVFEDTHDNFGLGVTLTQGWYAINSITFEVVPLSLDEKPVVLSSQEIAESIQNGAEQYIAEIFPIVKTIRYTVTEDNLFEFGDYVIVSHTKISQLNTLSEEIQFWLEMRLESCNFGKNEFDENIVRIMANAAYDGAEHSVTILYPHLKKIDEKFIPDNFATISDIEEFKTLVGDTAVPEQIASAVAQKTQVQIVTWEADD